MNSIKSTTLEFVSTNPKLMTPAMHKYLGKVTITAQANYDRWPELSGMRRTLFDLGDLAGLSGDQIVFDLDHAKIDCDGGRW